MQPKPRKPGMPPLPHGDPRPKKPFIKGTPQIVVDPKPPTNSRNMKLKQNFKSAGATRMGTGIVGKDGRYVNKLYQTP
jgi:hypothetical protein